MEVGNSSILVPFFFFLTEVWLIYNVDLVSGIQKSDSNLYLYLSIGYYKILNIIPCAMQ